MQTAEYPHIPADFGHWLAGFIDGEGSFLLDRKRVPGAFIPSLKLSLRDDDTPIIEEIVAATGLGTMSFARHTPHGMVVWQVRAKADCARLVELLDKYPLRAKKARDYAIWREAVVYWLGRQRARRGRRWAQSSWGPMHELTQRLRETRLYEPPPRPESEQPPALWED